MKVSQVKSGIGCTQDRACAADCHAFAGISLGGRKGSTNCGACRVSRCTELQNCWLEGSLEALTQTSNQCRIVGSIRLDQRWLFFLSKS